MNAIKIAISFPPNTRDLTHAARMCLQELLLAFEYHNKGHEFHLYAPESMLHLLGQVTEVIIPEVDGSWKSLRFEQFILARLIERMGADVLFLPYSAGPLGSSVPIVVLDAIDHSSLEPGFGGRLLNAVRAAGVQGAFTNAVYKDSQSNRTLSADTVKVEPWVHTSFRALSGMEDREIAARHGLPFNYVLAHGVTAQDVPIVLASWTWVDGSVGDTVPLVVLVSGESERQVWNREVSRMGLAHSVQVVHGVEFEDLPAVYRRAESLLLGGRGIQHQVLRWAMATGLPVTAFDVPTTHNVLESAGYLVKPGDTRALGAACLTVIVEPEVRQRLREAGLVRASAYHESDTPSVMLRQIVSAAGH